MRVEIVIFPALLFFVQDCMGYSEFSSGFIYILEFFSSSVNNTIGTLDGIVFKSSKKETLC